MRITGRSAVLDDLNSKLAAMDELARTDYLNAPLPSPEDDEIAALVEDFAAEGSSHRAGPSQRLTQVHQQVLVVFAVRMASQAVREGSVAHLRHGLLAMALASHAAGSDWRDLALQFEPLEDAGRRIGSRAGSVFEEAGRLANRRIAGIIRGASPSRFFLLRWMRRVRIPIPGVQRWSTVDTPSGLRYIAQPGYTEEDILRPVARGLMTYLSRALEAYRRDNGTYPTTEQGLLALWQAPTIEPLARNWRGPYIRRSPPRDPWSRTFIYRFPAEHDPASYDLLSYGANGQPGGDGDAADIRAWD